VLKTAPDDREYIGMETSEILDLCEGPANLGQLELLLYELQFRSPKAKEVKERKAQAYLTLLRLYQSSATKPKSPPPRPKWPTTNTQESRRKLAFNGRIKWREIGVLKASGYVVGETHGLYRIERHKILNAILLVDDLKDIEDRSYADEYGEPRTSKRLMKMANSLAMFAINAKRVSSRNSTHAINDWEEDLKYLKDNFYSKWPNFEWPQL